MTNEEFVKSIYPNAYAFLDMSTGLRKIMTPIVDQCPGWSTKEAAWEECADRINQILIKRLEQ